MYQKSFDQPDVKYRCGTSGRSRMRKFQGILVLSIAIYRAYFAARSFHVLNIALSDT